MRKDGTMKQPLLDIQHVEIGYQAKTVVHDITLQVSPGEILGIVGESGSGKSTFIKSIIGLLGRDGIVTNGSISYKGMDLLHQKEKQLRKLRGAEMGMIFQNTAASLCPVRTIEKQLYEMVLAHESVSHAKIKKRALDLFDKMNLKDGERILKSYPFELSGGMNQRVGIMMAMILKPNLLLADEPTSSLDVTIQAQVVREMMKMRDLFGTAIIIVTHNIGLVKFMADRIAVMYQGRLVEYGTKEEIFSNPQDPYTKKLIHSVLCINRG